MVSPEYKFVLFSSHNGTLKKIKTLYSAKKALRFVSKTQFNHPTFAKVKHVKSNLTFTCNNLHELVFFLKGVNKV